MFKRFYIHLRIEKFIKSLKSTRNFYKLLLTSDYSFIFIKIGFGIVALQLGSRQTYPFLNCNYISTSFKDQLSFKKDFAKARPKRECSKYKK